MGRPEWQVEIDEAVRRENWALAGPNRVIKIVPLSRAPTQVAGGYITVVKFVEGKDPQRIERDLGLPRTFLSSGVRAYGLARLPLAHEYEYDLTAKFPGGLHFNPAHSDPNYQPGAAQIHQWKIREGIVLPVDARQTIEVRPGQLFPRWQ